MVAAACGRRCWRRLRRPRRPPGGNSAPARGSRGSGFASRSIWQPSITASRCSALMPYSAAQRHQRPHHRVAWGGRRRLAPLPCATRPAWSRPRRVADLVDDVVDFAAKRIEGRDRRPPGRRQEQESVVEARAAAGGLVLHILLRRMVGRPAQRQSRHAGRTHAERRASSQRAPQQRGHPRCRPGAVQRREVHGFDLVQDAQAALHHQPQLPAGAARASVCDQRCAAQHQRPRPGAPGRRTNARSVGAVLAAARACGSTPGARSR